MPQPERNTTGLADAAERRHDHAVARARNAIRALDSPGETISFQSVARRRASRASSSTPSTSCAARSSGCAPRTSAADGQVPAPAIKRGVAEGAQPDAARREPTPARRNRRPARRARRRVGRATRRPPSTGTDRPEGRDLVIGWPTIDEAAFHGPAGEFVLRTDSAQRG